MESDNSSGSENIRLTLSERREILERIYPNLVSMIATYCPNLDPNQVNGYLRSIDFNHLDGTEREIIADLLPRMTAAIMPPETEEEGSI